MIRCAVACALSICPLVFAAGATAAQVQTGNFKNVQLPQRSPLSTIEESFRRTPRQFTGRALQTLDEMTPSERESLDYDLSKESVDVVVPGSARDGSPHGLFVWMGVTAPDPQWFGALARRRLIFVTPNNCNGRTPWLKRGLALDAVHNLSTRYTIDPSRVYLAGFSAGAHAAGDLIVQFPDVFRGSLCLMGGHYYQVNHVLIARDKPPAPEATMLGPRWYGDVEQLKQELRLVSVFGASDTVVPAARGRIDHDCLRLDGFQHAYIELPSHGHAHPNLSTFERALAALESKPAPPPTTAPIQGNARPHPDQLAQAKRLLTTGKMLYERARRTPAPAGASATTRRSTMPAADPADDAAVARRYLNELISSYPTLPAANDARALLAKLDALVSTAVPTPATTVPSTNSPAITPPR